MTPMKEFTVSLVILVEDDASFLEAGIDGDAEVMMEIFKDLVYDIDDTRLKEIQVEYTGD
jgi:hypothetical protein